MDRSTCFIRFESDRAVLCSLFEEKRLVMAGNIFKNQNVAHSLHMPHSLAVEVFHMLQVTKCFSPSPALLRMRGLLTNCKQQIFVATVVLTYEVVGRICREKVWNQKDHCTH